MHRSATHPSKPVRGFTLLELIVSVGLFMIVITIAASAYLAMIALNRRAQATNDVVSNLSFVVESMSRSIRTGTDYDCGPGGRPGEPGSPGRNCWPSGASTFTFRDEDGRTITYLRRSNNTVGACVNIACTDTSAVSLTDPRITITNLTFYTQGVGRSDQRQPRVIIVLSGSITPDPRTEPVTFTIQTSATQRLIDLES